MKRDQLDCVKLKERILSDPDLPCRLREAVYTEAKWWYEKYVWPWRADDPDGDDEGKARLAALAAAPAMQPDLDGLREALEWYAGNIDLDGNAWHSNKDVPSLPNIIFDQGKRAQTALAAQVDVEPNFGDAQPMYLGKPYWQCPNSEAHGLKYSRGLHATVFYCSECDIPAVWKGAAPCYDGHRPT